MWRQMFAEFSHGKIGIAVVDLATPIKEEFRQPESARSWMALWTFFVANPDGIGAQRVHWPSMRRPVGVNPFLCSWGQIHLLPGLNAIPCTPSCRFCRHPSIRTLL